MIFVGDIVSPTAETSANFLSSIRKWRRVFNGDGVVGNLEGLLSDDYHKANRPVLSSHPSVVEPLVLMNTRAVSLANNHALDMVEKFETTRDILSEKNIRIFGAGISREEAEKPARVFHDDTEYLISGYSWDFLMQHQKNRPGVMYVNPIRTKKILSIIENQRRDNPKSVIVLKMHWNFDLETIPFPLHREFSRAMIDAGADAVIGSHSHCVQGGERYKKGLIVYGLGNFFFPWYVFTSGKSYFPDWTRTELAVQWSPKTQKIRCHWFEYQYGAGQHELCYLESEDFDTGTIINSYSPFRSMSQDRYIKWYRKNRRKGFLMPVYKDHRDVLRNRAIDFYLKYRNRFARFLAQWKLREWKR